MARRRIVKVPEKTPMYTESGAMSRAWILFLQSLHQDTAGMVTGTHAERLADYPAEDTAPGTVFYELDRTVYYISDGAAWKYYAGQMAGTLAPNQKPTDLNAGGDVGFRFRSTEFKHTYRWTGSAWTWADEDMGSLHVVWTLGNPPAGGLWALCDGAYVDYATSTGGVGLITLPNLIDKYVKGSGSYTGSAVAAVAPTLSGSTGSTSAGPTTTSSSGVQVATSTTSGVFAGDGTHYHGTSAHTHDAGTLAVSATGEPAHVKLTPYVRR